MSRRGVVFLAGFAAFAAVIWLGVREAAGAPDVAVGTMAPDFRAASIAPHDSTIYTIADYRGQVVLLNLWATWCGPCVVEMPSIQRLYERYRDRGLRVVGISVDDPPFAGRIREFVKEHGLTFEILHEGSGAIERDYRSRGLPATYIIGTDGRIRVIRQGATDWDSPSHRAVVEHLLGAGGGSVSAARGSSP